MQSLSKSPGAVEKWVRGEYNQRHCDKDGRLVGAVNLDVLTSKLVKLRPDVVAAIRAGVKRLHMEICEELSRDFSVNQSGQFDDAPALSKRLQQARPDLGDNCMRKKVILQLQKTKKAALSVMPPSAQAKLHDTSMGSGKSDASQRQTGMKDHSLMVWISSFYQESGFKGSGFIGWKAFTNALVKARPERSHDIKLALEVMRRPGHTFSLAEPNKVHQQRKAKKEGGGTGVKLIDIPVATQPLVQASSVQKKKPIIPLTRHDGVQLQQPKYFPDSNNLLLSDQNSNSSMEDSTPDDSSVEGPPYPSRERFQLNYRLMNQLITPKDQNLVDDVVTDTNQRDIGHAPLLAEMIVCAHTKDLTPQFGFLGSQGLGINDLKVFQNTNVPFSTFICGVQGSGKSHTTACMLENALIPSEQLGRLEAPVAALVFSYGEFSNGGSEFTVSEAAYLASTNRSVAGQRVKNITVLVSPSNPAIKKIYRAIPGVKVLDFKLKAKSLDIGTLLTLMCVNEKLEVPLYMARVESILRTIATESEDGFFDYNLFRQKIALENFDPKQINMLEMRLGLLESFLETNDQVPEPTFRPGEMTIMDLSDPFVTANTACILFKLGLVRFMQSKTPGKMVVLDEAHKYMLDTPGSTILTSYLATLIRLQRHRGVRVVISTQEPTVSTDLIALCSVTVIHRFTSPAWYSALKKHISAMDNDKEILRQIESLDTGEALVYAPTAVMGKKEDGTLVKLPGQLLKLNIRKRITQDGGESIMAV